MKQADGGGTCKETVKVTPLTEGEWLVKVTTQYAGSSGTLTKAPRSFELPRPVTIGAVTDGGSTGDDDEDDGNHQLG